MERPEVSWLLLDLNSYFASCEQQNNPELRHRPVGVVPLFADTTCCIAASYEAKAFGVKTGTKVGDARKMCPGITFVQARHSLYVEYHHKILEAIESQLPIHSVLSIDEMACELTGSHSRLDRAIELAKEIKESIHTKVGKYLKSSVGIATNRYLAKVASDMQKPDGLTALLRHDLPHALFHLELRDLPGIGPRMEQRLHQSGIKTIKTLCALPKEGVRKVWGGIYGDYMYDWMRGEPVDLPRQSHRSLGHQHVLGPELRTREGSSHVFKQLIFKLTVRLRKEGYFTKNLTVQVKFMGDKPSWEKRIKFEETQDTYFLMRKVNEILQEIPDHKPIRVGVMFLDLVDEESHQLSFFESRTRTELNKAMDTINQKYGRNTLVPATLRETNEPESRIAFQRVPDLDEF